MTIDINQTTGAAVPSTAAANRGTEIKVEGTTATNVNIGLYEVDEVLINYMNQRIQPSVTQDNVKVVVPVVYANPERWKAVQKDGAVRDKQGRIQLPLILLRRTSMSRNKMNNPMNRYHYQSFYSGWNKRNAYDRFTVYNGIHHSQEKVNVVIPDYYDINYEIVLWTEYLSQLNELVEQISFETEDYWGERNQYKFLVNVDEYKIENAIAENADRMVKCYFNMTVKAYLLPESMLDKQENRVSTTTVGYTTKKVVFKEHIVSDL